MLVRACTFLGAVASATVYGVNARERDAFSGASNDKEYRRSSKDDIKEASLVSHTHAQNDTCCIKITL